MRTIMAAPPALNQQQIESEIDEGIVEVATVPYDVQFSSEHRCNLRCVMCWATVARNAGVVPLMDQRLPNNTLERFKKLEPYLPSFRMLSLTGSGEPLLSPALPDILTRVAPHREVRTTFTTHGQLIDLAKARMLVASGLWAITVSADGVRKETHERIRVHSKWEKFLRAVNSLILASNAARAPDSCSLPGLSWSKMVTIHWHCAF